MKEKGDHEMNRNSFPSEYQKVTSVNGELQATLMQTTLEQAGIPVALFTSRSGAALDVLVPVEFVYDAQNLLAPERRSGEIFFVPARS
jgi:hypothetical protein